MTVSPGQHETASIISAEEKHLEEMVAVHTAAFPGEYLTLLGPSFLKAFYRYYINHPEGIALVAIDAADGCVMGLVAGGAPALRSSFLRSHVVRFVLTALAKSLVHRRVRRRTSEHIVSGFVAIARKLHLAPRRTQPPAPEDPPGTWSNLLSICTHPKYRGRGVGKRLMDGFRAASAARGYKTMRLSVHNDNEAAKALYCKSGWQAILTVPSGTYFKRSVEVDE